MSPNARPVNRERCCDYPACRASAGDTGTTALTRERIATLTPQAIPTSRCCSMPHVHGHVKCDPRAWNRRVLAQNASASLFLGFSYDGNALSGNLSCS